MSNKLKNFLLSSSATVAAVSGLAFAVSCNKAEEKKPENPEKPDQATQEQALLSKFMEDNSYFTSTTEGFANYYFKFEKNGAQSNEFVFWLVLKNKDGDDVSHDNGSKQFTIELKELNQEGTAAKENAKTFTATSTFVAAEKKVVAGRELDLPPHYEFKIAINEGTTAELSSLGISSLKYDTNTDVILAKK
ncbi:hypothetical protein [Mycoplasma procyoni]|uniref:hypothetical protein n=1 Tax=Mycoplasma procyoni TaxID=568784 RepID=UPI00197BAF10|nr:hypothetical protein [Mycoplasma procyoni]MBN3534597.1 hypothetical protein [Mycoplasma procyoni]